MALLKSIISIDHGALDQLQKFLRPSKTIMSIVKKLNQMFSWEKISFLKTKKYFAESLRNVMKP